LDFCGNSVELFLPPKPTTTSAPFVFTTAKTRRKQHQHKDKGHHESKGRDSFGQSLIPRENDLHGGAMLGEGKSSATFLR
jgi:hypothetical protein